MRREIERVHDLVDIAKCDTSFGKAIRDGVDGEVAGMFLSTEPLLGSGRNQFTVNEQRRGGVVSLRDAIFAVIEARPMRLLKGNGFFEAADSENDHSGNALIRRIGICNTLSLIPPPSQTRNLRSEERRVGKECRSR